MSFLAWFWIIYISAGIFLLMDDLVIVWETSEYHWSIKVVGFIIAVLIWPVAFIK
jgi:hypothetical protein